MKISVITPSFNQGRFIERTIQSVLSQKEINLEYIIMDGGSQDQTISIINQYRDQLYAVSGPDHGQAHAVNKGLQISTGEIIGWLNSDDIYYPDTVKQVLNTFLQRPDIDVIYGGAYHIDEQDNVLEKYPTASWNFKHLVKTCYLSQPAVFFRRCIIERYGLLDETLNYCMDYEYWLRLAKEGARFFYLDKILAGSRLYSNTKTMRAPHEATQETVNMLQRKLGWVPATWLLNAAVCTIKQKTSWRWPQLRYIVSIGGILGHQAFKYNGTVGGILALSEVTKLLLRKISKSK